MDLNFVETYRRHVRYVPGGEVHEEPSLTAVFAPCGEAIHNPVLVHGPTTADEVLGTAERCHGARGRKHVVFTRAHADAHLDAGLEAAGYRMVWTTPAMCLTADRFRPVPPPQGLEIRVVATEEDAAAYGDGAAEAFAVYGVPYASVRGFFASLACVAGDGVQAFLGWQEGAPVTGAMLYASHGVAGIGWVWTRPALFGRRLGEAATSAVLRAAAGRGLALANLQASPLGRKVYERMGFATPTEYKTFFPVG
jgi:hypothetical protein